MIIVSLTSSEALLDYVEQMEKRVLILYEIQY